MRSITKGQVPPSLTAHRQTPNANYDNYTAKDDLRGTLVMEQRGLCCYCMGRIRPDPVRINIEHWQCQSRFPDEQLTYRNLLGACIGGRGHPRHLQHCDARKGDSDLQLNPAEPTHHIETRVRYELDGTIRADNPLFDEQLNDVLNLNLPQIKNNRKSVLTSLLDWWKAETHRLRGPLPQARIESEISARTDGVGDLVPYCQVAVWWLAKKLRVR